MSKNFDTLEINIEVVETISPDVTKLDDLSLMLVGGGEYVIAV